MRLLITLLLFVLISFHSRGQETDSAFTKKETICVFLDSLEITNKKLLNEFDGFYRRNQDLIDSNSYFDAFILRFKEGDSTSFIFNISIGLDLENDLQLARRNNSGYFRINNTLVFVSYLNDSIGVYKRVNRKQFCFNRREEILACNGHCSESEAGFKITIKSTDKIKVRKLYFFKKPFTDIKRFYYRIRYRYYF